MAVIFVLIGFSLLVAIGFLVAFIWSIRSGQYEDDYTPSVRILFDDENNEEGSDHESNEIPDKKPSIELESKPKT